VNTSVLTHLKLNLKSCLNELSGAKDKWKSTAWFPNQEIIDLCGLCRKTTRRIMMPTKINIAMESKQLQKDEPGFNQEF
jgi:hypothetical protein